MVTSLTLNISNVFKQSQTTIWFGRGKNMINPNQPWLCKLINFLMFLYYICKIVHKSLMLNALFALLDFLQISDSLIVWMCSITIDVLPVLSPFLTNLELILNWIQRTYNAIVCLSFVYAIIESLMFLLLDESVEVLFCLAISQILVFLLFLFYLNHVFSIVFDTLDFKATLLLSYFFSGFHSFFVHFIEFDDFFVKVVLLNLFGSWFFLVSSF